MKERLAWLDGMKGIGILIVMLGHFCHLPLILNAGFMPLFFFAAGFTYKPSLSFKDTISKKGKRLLIPWLVYGLIIFIVERGYDLISHTFSWSLFIEKLTGLLYMRCSFYWPYDNAIYGNMLSTNGPMWFLCTMFCVFLYMVVYERCQRKWAFVSGLILLAFLTYQLPIQFPWGAELALIGTLTMLVAIRHKQELVEMGEAEITITLVISLIIYCLLTFYNGHSDMMFRDYGTHGYLSVPIFFMQGILYSLVALSACRLIEKLFILKALSYIGRNSMRLLCIHLFIGEYTKIVLSKLISVSVHWSDYLMACVYIALVLVINEALNRIFAKYQNKYTVLKWI